MPPGLFFVGLYTSTCMARHLYIALVTPFSWSVPSAVNLHVAALARELKRRGHRPVVVVSSDHRDDEHRERALFHRSRGQVVALLAKYHKGEEADSLLLPTVGAGPLEREAGIPVVSMGSSFPIRLGGGVASLGLPVDMTSRLEKLMLGGEFDLVHVHEPLAPSLSFSALREARSPVVATFHLTPAAVAAYEMGETLLDRFFSRLDGRVVTFLSGRAMLDELYPGDYAVVPAGTDLAPMLRGLDGAFGTRPRPTQGDLRSVRVPGRWSQVIPRLGAVVAGDLSQGRRARGGGYPQAFGRSLDSTQYPAAAGCEGHADRVRAV